MMKALTVFRSASLGSTSDELGAFALLRALGVVNGILVANLRQTKKPPFSVGTIHGTANDGRKDRRQHKHSASSALGLVQSLSSFATISDVFYEGCRKSRRLRRVSSS